MLTAMALDTYVNEYTGAAPDEEIRRAQELAKHYWGLTAEAERREKWVEEQGE
jgi:hypothetical protein